MSERGSNGQARCLIGWSPERKGGGDDKNENSVARAFAVGIDQRRRRDADWHMAIPGRGGNGAG